MQHEPTIRQIGIRVPAALGARLEAQAAQEHNSVSAVVRRLLTVALKRVEARAEAEADR